ncbi:universal stress protein [Arcanobacterium haemolyticum]|uniref:UspA domain protein n=1 Tax=Arcanobacterium haemolyticum (strain ATCC 9345 / DSM 20595 / CCM 5947 / CCUG 17215 / LMG 16163 / NBRC 15585 / NCTC 8452 / 11018) TaxID=644284 RepID=D7BKX3_ARCHD|nr:universal stress protein [Arcanobacterium haemolyticum]ADH93303.1 UspA domain protein [Arcanobacterium haemolyticum DSM 20595]QCX47334.1 universal stress protein [Arcanobacterium haemolyticum]SPT75806.1 Universal stress protein Rv2623/MT2698 [Arcanobacterium haemolyticum]SQH27864.1 Universal stress protein Rv2623/MT2698 [Arcanobacterium haemolyticum]
MSHENIVVVGIDGSPAAQSALTWAHAQAKARGARLHLVCAYELPSYAPEFLPTSGASIPVGDSGFLYKAAEDMIRAAADSLDGQGVDVTWSLEFGDPTEVLVEMSKRVALVVVGGREASSNSLADRLLRTVSSAVPSNACCPTVVVPAGKSADDLPVKHIVVGVDGSAHAKTALQRAVWEADRWGAKLSIVATVNTAAATWIPADTFRDDFLEEVADSVRVQLAEVDEGREIDVDIHAIEGNPAQVLVEFSKEVDLLVIGTRGRGGFAGLLLGSTSQSVLAITECPTMVVPRRVRPGDDVGPEPKQVVDE